MVNNAKAIVRGLLEQGMTKAAIGKSIGYDRTSVSRWMSEADYNGAHIEAAVLARYNRFTCPHLVVEITPQQCATYASRACPTCNVREVRHWKACQSCAHKPNEAKQQGETK